MAFFVCVWLTLHINAFQLRCPLRLWTLLSSPQRWLREDFEGMEVPLFLMKLQLILWSRLLFLSNRAPLSSGQYCNPQTLVCMNIKSRILLKFRVLSLGSSDSTSTVWWVAQESAFYSSVLEDSVLPQGLCGDASGSAIREGAPGPPVVKVSAFICFLIKHMVKFYLRKFLYPHLKIQIYQAPLFVSWFETPFPTHDS